MTAALFHSKPMCGIVGIVDADLPTEEIGALLDRMASAIRHRGPDDRGRTVFAEERAGLAARRLSIVDLDGGSQPVANEDGSVHVAFNGEIYNHTGLRAWLQSRGHRFRSRCDTEVIVHLYEELGDECLTQLDGMFGLAVFDRRLRRLLLARDGPGMKPLYVAETPRGLLFASEVKALLASGLIDARPDPASINTYLALGYFPAPYCGFKGIEKLRAGEFVVVEAGQLQRKRFWQYRCRADCVPRRDEEYGEELEQLLTRAVRTHLAADVPVGALVSGGWDSSLLATLAARQTSGRLKTFSIVFPDDPRQDESRYSRLMADYLGTEHHEIEFRASLVPDLLPQVVRHLEEPVAAAPALLIYLISSLASRHVKSVLTGEGADEIFGGYRWLREEPAARRSALRRFVSAIRHRRFTDWMRTRTAIWPLDRAGGRGDDDVGLEGLRSLTPWDKNRVLRPEFRAPGPDLEPVRLDSGIAASCPDRIQRRIAFEFTARLADRVLLQGDKMSMAHSLETRMPFLDRAVVDFAQRLPSNLKIRGTQEKYVLSLLGGHLPPAVAQRRKQGLMYPEHRLREGPVAGELREILLDGTSHGGPFDGKFLERHYDRWLRPGQPLFRRPLMLVLLQVWWNEFMSC